MDYRKLAIEFIHSTHKLRKIEMPKKFTKAMKGELFAIFYILYTKEKVSPKMIREEMDITSARTSRMLNSMEKKNLIRRLNNEDDKRGVYIELTQEGIELAEETKNKVVFNVEKMLKKLNEDDAKDFVRIVKILAE